MISPTNREARHDQLYGDSRYTFLTWNGLAGTLLTGTLTPDSFPVVQDALEAEAGG